MADWTLAGVAGTLLAYIAVRTLRPRAIAPAIVFTAAGFLLGTEVLSWIDLTLRGESLKLLAEVTLALVLFSDASRIDLRALRDGYGLPARLLGIGLPLTIVGGALAALAVLPHLLVAEAVVLSVVLAATDAALGQAVVTDERLPASIRQGLNVESGLNDGLCVPVLIIALTITQADANRLDAAGALRVVAESIGYGMLMGAVAGSLAGMVHRRSRPTDDEERREWGWLLSPVTAAFAYGLATPLGGSGFIAAFVAGGAYGALRGRGEEGGPQPTQDLGALLNAVTFIVFGAAFMKPLIDGVTWQIALYALLSLTVVRMLPVWVAMLGTRSRPATILYLGWFGPRGLASIVFGVLVVEANTPHANTIVVATALTVTASILLHGLSAGPLTERYTRLLTRRPRSAGVEAAPAQLSVPAATHWPGAPKP